jgi:hypothetical protein
MGYETRETRETDDDGKPVEESYDFLYASAAPNLGGRLL